MRKSNKQLIEEALNSIEYKLGCWDNDIEKLSKKEIEKVTNSIKQDCTDTDVRLNRKNYVVEFYTIDGEVDFSLITREEYINRYGDERYED